MPVRDIHSGLSYRWAFFYLMVRCSHGVFLFWGKKDVTLFAKALLPLGSVVSGAFAFARSKQAKRGNLYRSPRRASEHQSVRTPYLSE
jgi:hypothetical protein